MHTIIKTHILILLTVILTGSVFAQEDDTLDIKPKKDTVDLPGRFKLSWHIDFLHHPLMTRDSIPLMGINTSMPFSAFVGWIQPLNGHINLDFGIETAFKYFKAEKVRYIDNWGDTLVCVYYGRIHSLNLPMGLDYYLGKKIKFGLSSFLVPKLNAFQYHPARETDMKGNSVWMDLENVPQFRMFNVEARAGMFAEFPTRKKKNRSMRLSGLIRGDLLSVYKKIGYKRRAWSFGLGIEFVF